MKKKLIISVIFFCFTIMINNLSKMNISNEDDEFFEDEDIVYTSNEEINKKIEPLDDVKHKSTLKLN